MRFRAKISDVGCLAHFSRAVSTVAKLAKACALRLTADRLFFIAGARGAEGGARLWCEVSQGNVFDEFQMEGVAAEKNEIYLEVTPENLARALKTAQNAKAVKIKLTNKHCPCLTVAVELPSLSSTSRVVTHDIPVGIIPRKQWNDFREPNVPDFDVSIYLPALKTMKSVVERMKNLCNSIVIEANLNGEMNLKIETDLVCVTTHFKELGNPPWGAQNIIPACTQTSQVSHIDQGTYTDFWPFSATVPYLSKRKQDMVGPQEPRAPGRAAARRGRALWQARASAMGVSATVGSQKSSQERDPEAMAEARIDIKRLLQLLAGQQVNPTKALCNIASNRMVHFILLHEDVSLQYFIPALV